MISISAEIYSSANLISNRVLDLMRSSFLPNNRMYHHADSESYRHRQIECFRSRCGGRGALIICKAGDSYLIVECSATFRVLVPPSMCNPRCYRQVAL